MALLRNALLALGMLAAVPAAADAPPATVDRCRSLLMDGVRRWAGAIEPGDIAPEGPTGCRYRNVFFSTFSRGGYRIDSLLIRGVPLELTRGPAPSLSVQVEARGITFSSRSGSAKTDWMIGQQQTPFDVTLDAGYDAASRQVTLRELTMDGAFAGHVSLSATVDNVALAEPPDDMAFESAMAIGVRSLRLDFDSRRILSILGLPLLLTALPDTDPGGAVEAVKTRVAGTLRVLLPGGGFSPDAVEAIVGFVQDFPRPQHPFSLSVSADPPVDLATAARSGSDPMQILAAMMPRLRGTASYVGAAR